jgi:catechol 2,3-dioxygenase-like lactoylglutathione lyase family enzyme
LVLTAEVLSEMPAQSIARIVPILPVRNLARAMDFYRLLGFSTHAWQDGDGYAFLTRDQLDVHLRTAPDLLEGQNPSGVYFYLADNTAAALEAEFCAAGVKILSPLTPREWKMNEFVLSDPDGNLLRFGEDIS